MSGAYAAQEAAEVLMRAQQVCEELYIEAE